MIALYPCLEVMFVEWCKNSIRPRLVGRPGFRQKRQTTTTGNVGLLRVCHVPNRPESKPKTKRSILGLCWVCFGCTGTILIQAFSFVCIVPCHDDHNTSNPVASTASSPPPKKKKKSKPGEDEEAELKEMKLWLTTSKRLYGMVQSESDALRLKL